ncbi:hypothetical protein VCHC17A1_3959B, partial [Vibrio cholerae HC-17A1]
ALCLPLRVVLQSYLLNSRKDI